MLLKITKISKTGEGLSDSLLPSPLSVFLDRNPPALPSFQLEILGDLIPGASSSGETPAASKAEAQVGETPPSPTYQYHSKDKGAKFQPCHDWQKTASPRRPISEYYIIIISRLARDYAR